MRVRWTTDAAEDLERICDYIAHDRPESGRRVAESVVERIGTWKPFRTSVVLAEFPAHEKPHFRRCRSWRSTKF
jgi:plasmid stabilization system protein ParE